MPAISDDIRELVEIFICRNVEFAVCGGHAVAFHGYPRLTMDVDLLLNPTVENAARVMDALRDFGFGDAGIPQDAFAKAGTAVTLGVQPNQVDLLTSISSIPTGGVMKRTVWGEFEGLEVRFIGREDLLEAKRQAGRPKDLADLHELERFDSE